jgi:hypothetical protein
MRSVTYPFREPKALLPSFHFDTILSSKIYVHQGTEGSKQNKILYLGVPIGFICHLVHEAHHAELPQGSKMSSAETCVDEHRSTSRSRWDLLAIEVVGWEIKNPNRLPGILMDHYWG